MVIESAKYIEWSYDYLEGYEYCEAMEAALLQNKGGSSIVSVEEMLGQVTGGPDMGRNLQRDATAFDAAFLKGHLLYQHQTMIGELRKRKHNQSVLEIGKLLPVCVMAEKLLRMKEAGESVVVDHQLRLVRKFIKENEVFIPSYEVGPFHRMPLTKDEENDTTNVIKLHSALASFKTSFSTRKDHLDTKWTTIFLRRMHRVQRTLEMCFCADDGHGSYKRRKRTGV